jgi:hypothetical protein
VREALRVLEVDKARQDRAATALQDLPQGFTVALEQGRWSAPIPPVIGKSAEFIATGTTFSNGTSLAEGATGTAYNFETLGASGTAVNDTFETIWSTLDVEQRNVAVTVANDWLQRLGMVPAGDVVYEAVTNGVAEAASAPSDPTDDAVRDLTVELGKLTEALQSQLDLNHTQAARVIWLRIAGVVAMLLIAGAAGAWAARGGEALARGLGVAIAIYALLASIDPKTGRQSRD